MSQQDLDILIIGAGLSGVGTACQLAEAFPDKRLALVERRQSVGGTWDLFRYPGIRSDSDMLTFGYGFHPWNDLKVLADGPSIRSYIRETARKYGIEQKIRFGLKILRANWCHRQRRWTVTARHEERGETQTFSCRFLISCTGYYNHDAGFLPQFPGVERFGGRCIHPQQWPEDLDYAGKKVVIIGSGATAVTLVPAMADKAGHVTMLQRSPSYIFSLPAYDKISAVLSKLLPQRWVYALGRQRNILIQRWLYQACRRWPQLMRRWLLSHVRKQVGPDVDMRHFTPRYMPWDERLCAVPDADLFVALREKRASVVTDEIETFTETGIRLKSGQELTADIIVTATGLNLQLLGGIEIAVDDEPRPLNTLMTYKGVLVEELPNLAWIFGYTNAPWTLKADIASSYLCRLLRHMDAQGMEYAVPRDASGCRTNDSILGALQSGYVQRATHLLPRQGRQLPWRVLHDYKTDRQLLLEDPIEDGVLHFVPAAQSRPSATGQPLAASA